MENSSRGCVLSSATDMTLRRLLASLIALTMVAAAPGLAQASVAPGGDCVTVSSPAAEDGCCGGAADVSSCSLPCFMGQAAIGETAADFMPLLDGSPLEDYAVRARPVSRPPDTAPPKLLS